MKKSRLSLACSLAIRRMGLGLLGYGSLTLAGGWHGAILAQDGQAGRQGINAGQQIVCDNQGCAAADELLFRVHTTPASGAESDVDPKDGEADAVPDTEASENRPPQQPLTGRESVSIPSTSSLSLPQGGAVWAVEDPQLGMPELNVRTTSEVAFAEGRIVEPVRFRVYNNYADFMERLELVLYKGTDSDLTSPLAAVDVPKGNIADAEWSGDLPAGHNLQIDDELLYVLRAYGSDGQMDETYPQSLRLVSTEERDQRRRDIRQSAENLFGQALSESEAEQRSLQDELIGNSMLRLQNIPLNGSKVRIQGRSIVPGSTLRINGQNHPVNLQGEMMAEYLVPVGFHQFQVEVNRAGQRFERTLDVNVTGRYMFMVALADVTVSRNSVGGSVEPLSGDERFDSSLYSEGRLAFYLKGKIRGKYLITAQADTQEHEISEMFDGFWKADPQDVFRRLDPDAYYPVYGDDSITYRDVDTMGRLYLRVDWDRNQGLWGNFNTGFTGNEFAQYSRSLYGGALRWRSQETNPLGEARTELSGFVSEMQTAPGHNEFIGTGGSLYYLRHTGILPGSERVVLEVRDPTTGRVEDLVEMLRGADYEIDELQGRIILTRPLTQVSQGSFSRISRDLPMDGLQHRLLVDYEYVPDGFDPDEAAAGLRARQWLTDKIAVGVTYVDESRAGDNYSLQGADITLQLDQGTYVKLEHAETESTSAPAFYSDNAGFDFTELNAISGPRAGAANAIEARINLQELVDTDNQFTAAAWWREVEGGYSVGRIDAYGDDILEYGAEMLVDFNSLLRLRTRYSLAERGVDYLEQAQLTGEWRLSDANTLSGEVRDVSQQVLGVESTGTLGAVNIQHRFSPSLEVHATAQTTLRDDGGNYAPNDMVSVGGSYMFQNLPSLGFELSSGDRGDAGQLISEYQLSSIQTIYGQYSYSTDTTEYDSLFNNRVRSGWTLGQRRRMSNQLNLFNESQYLKEPSESGILHTFGMDFYPSLGWNLGLTLQDGSLDRITGGQVDRQAVSLAGGHTSQLGQWTSKLEFRRDSGAESRRQWVSTNRAVYKLSESLRVAGRLNYSRTRDQQDARANARFIEGNLGMSYRPWNNTRYAVLARYTYLYDLSTLAQIGGATRDQRSNVLSLEGVYYPVHNWEFAARYAYRQGEVRDGRGTGSWFDSEANFAALQARYKLHELWHGLAEYRVLDLRNGGTRLGWLVGVDRDITSNLRLGIGYNFADFSDDLTNFDYDHRGWFINLVGFF